MKPKRRPYTIQDAEHMFPQFDIGYNENGFGLIEDIFYEVVDFEYSIEIANETQKTLEEVMKKQIEIKVDSAIKFMTDLNTKAQQTKITER